MSNSKNIILVKFGEIALKKGNRRFFINKLAERIKNIVPESKIKLYYDRLLVTKKNNLPTHPQANTRDASGIAEDWQTKTSKKISQLFGVAYTAPAEALKPEINIILLRTLEKKLNKFRKAKSFKIEANRANKDFPLTSVEIENKLGQAIVDKYRLKVNLKNPELTIYVDVTKNNAFIYTKRFKGNGGLPVGSSGRGVVLLSGGIDSAAASWKMLRRGIHLDFVHFHSLPPNTNFKKTIPAKIVEKLTKPQGIKSQIYFLPYYNFQLALAETKSKQELILFRRFMMRAAEKIAKKKKAKIIITGDNLGQVASQTLENLTVTDKAADILVARPLIGENKDEIIKLAKRIGTYELSIKPYKDCCSIIDRHPTTKARLSEVENLESKFDIDKILNKTLKEAVKTTIP